MLRDEAKIKIMLGYILDILRREMIWNERRAAIEKFQQADRKFQKMFLEVKRKQAMSDKFPIVFYDGEGMQIIVANDGGTAELCRLNGGCEEITGERYTELLKIEDATNHFQKHSPHSLSFNYKNYRGEVDMRTVHPIKLWHGSTEYHTEPQWLLKAYDPTKGDERDFAMTDIVGEDRWRAIADVIEQEVNLNIKDMLPVGHIVLEQAENIGTGTVTQAVQRGNGSEYHRIVDTEEAYSFHGRERTMILDTTGRMICVGDIIRHPIQEPFQEMHGTWGEYVVEKAPGGYRLSYWQSEKGKVMPRGYTGGYMQEFVLDHECKVLKEMVFALVPVRSTTMTIMGKSDV
jgi:hypothetical protein